MLFLTSFLISLSLHGSAAQMVTSDGCFEAIPNCGVRCSSPYATTTATSQQDCLNQCRQDTRCVGAQFNQFAFGQLQNCRLFNIVPGTAYPYVPFAPGTFGGMGGGQFGGGFGGGGNGGFRGGPGGFGQGNGGVFGGGLPYFPSRFMMDEVKKGASVGDIKLRWDPDASTEAILRDSEPIFRKPDESSTDKEELIMPPLAPAIKGSPLSAADIKQVIANTLKEDSNNTMHDPMSSYFGRQPYFYQNSGDILFRWRGTCSRTGVTVAPATIATALPLIITTVRLRPTTPATPTPAPPLPAIVQCRPSEVPKFLKLENTELAGLDDYTFTASSVNDCRIACMNNALPDRSQAPCLSLDYDRSNGYCALSLDSLPPRGTGTMSQALSKDYYEKVCLPRTLVEGCNDVLEQIPGMILVGYAGAVTTETGYAECIRTCLSSQQLFGFECLSGQFFSDSDEQNCILNEESRNTKPSMINFNGNEKVYYFDFECKNRRSPLGEPLKRGTSGNIILPARAGWGPWSACNRKNNKVIRYRNCTSHNPGSCQKESQECNKKQ